LAVSSSRPLMQPSTLSSQLINGFGSALLLRDVEVHDVLGGVLEVAKLLL
jgi:hypothetical protein